MIPNITRGSDATGLTAYLVGEGRANEHINPHLVAGSSPIMAWYDDVELSHQNAIEIGRELEQPHRVFGTDVSEGHIWQCSLSLHKDDGILSDEEWADVARSFVRDMGFIDVEGKADTRWIVVRHGLSGQNGNDHVHLVVSLVREDGTKANTWMDYKKAQRVARDLEKKHGLLQIVEGRGAVGLSQGMIRGSEGRGRSEPEQTTLARRIRAHAEASATEAEFVRRCRIGGLLIRPSYGKHGDDEVIGYKVALKPPKGQRAIYCGGMKMGRDLGLGTLRQNWPDTPEDKREAAEEWYAAKFGRRMVGPSPIGEEPDLMAWEDAAKELTSWQAKMRDVPLDDHERWRSMAAHVAGVWSSWSVAVEPEPGPFAAVADELAKSAQVSRSHYQKPPAKSPMRLRAATVLTFAAASGGPSAQWAVFAALTNLTREIYNYNQHREDEVRQRSFKKMMTEDLAKLSKRMRSAVLDHEGIVESVTATRGLAPVREHGSVLPTKLEPTGARPRDRVNETGLTR